MFQNVLESVVGNVPLIKRLIKRTQLPSIRMQLMLFSLLNLCYNNVLISSLKR